ncbi:MAG: hypothetical protein EPN82_13425 [Bacteroidetes bacterium]|nr:MAG: hypothetical protein EPN82_13425 [Bacteroidota bacterium]
MTRLLIFFLIVIGILVFVYSGIKGMFRRFTGSTNVNASKFHNENDKNKSKVIYDKNNIVVMKGDAPEKDS